MESVQGPHGSVVRHEYSFGFTFGLDCNTLHTILMVLAYKDDKDKINAALDDLKQRSDAAKAAMDAASQNAGT